MFIVRPPSILRNIIRGLHWDVPEEDRVIYLTFDDGPIPHVTKFILEQLNIYNAKATFFMLGNNVEKNPYLLNDILKHGHSVGNHTHNHLNGFRTETTKYLEDIKKAEVFIKSNLFRPPYGRLKLSTKNEILKTKKIVMWDVLSGDYSSKLSPQTVTFNVINFTRPGSVIVFHDSLKAFKNLKISLPAVLEHFSLQGWRFNSITEDMLLNIEQK